MRTLRTFDCEDCGAPTTRMRHPHQSKVCLSCGTLRAVRAAIEVHEAKAAGWPEGGRWNREQFAAPMRARWKAWGVRGAR